MFDTINIGTSGLLVHAKGLRVVGNNLANVNTPGFKSSQLQFAELFDQGSGNPQQSGSSNAEGLGTGLASVGSQINFRAGLDQSTGNPLDLNIGGNGFYAIKRDGDILYTRAGDFHFDDKGKLVNSAGDAVLALDTGGQLKEVTLDNFEHSKPKVTGTVTFRGNLTTTVASPVVDAKVNNIKVYDAGGTERVLTATFVNNGAGDYTVSVADAGGTVLGSQHLKFIGGFPDPAASSMSINVAGTGFATFAVKLDFSKDVTALADPSTLAMATQDGYVAGVRSDVTIETDGNVKIHYSNGQSVMGQRLALANFDAGSALEQVGGSAFSKKAEAAVTYGYAGTASFGTLQAGRREGSNVDLAEEFGNLILMQRGYQASSHVISTANDMIQQLFDMKR